MIHPKPEISFGTELKLRSFERKRESGEYNEKTFIHSKEKETRKFRLLRFLGGSEIGVSALGGSGGR